MNIAIRVVAGPLKDKVFPITKALTIGRQGDITLEDPTVSSLHARIEKGPDGGWVLADNDSKNGVKVGDIKVKSSPLKPGLIFYIGDHGFAVISQGGNDGTVVMPMPKTTESKSPPPTPAPTPKKKEKEKEKAVAKPAKAAAAPAPAPSNVPSATPQAVTPDVIPKTVRAAAPKPKKQQKYWFEALGDFLKTHKDAFKDTTIPLVPLEPAVVLEFVRGLQMNSKWVLGYGPRKLGPGTIDLPIWEPGAPEVCFELQPTADGILFKTSHSDVVLLNNEQVDSRLLRVGDTISIHETMIEVDFIE